MLKYLVILLDRRAVSFCHYSRYDTRRQLIPKEVLRKAIFFGMRMNLNIQFVYPDYELNNEYKAIINTIDHADIKPASLADTSTDVAIFEGLEQTENFSFQPHTAYIVRTSKDKLFATGTRVLPLLLAKVSRLNVIITDLETFTQTDFDAYRLLLETLSSTVEKIYIENKTPQINILTDRMFLTRMNNCNAGDQSLCLAPDGKFYICPGFFYEDDKEFIAGDLEHGLNIPNQQLFRLDHAPICRVCDAFQCKRCALLNRRTTLEVNTPGHEQCVVSHIEREASRKLMTRLRMTTDILSGCEVIKELDYNDPFEIARR